LQVQATASLSICTEVAQQSSSLAVLDRSPTPVGFANRGVIHAPRVTKTSCQSIIKIMVVDDKREDEEVSVPVMVMV